MKKETCFIEKREIDAYFSFCFIKDFPAEKTNRIVYLLPVVLRYLCFLHSPLPGLVENR